MSPSDKREHPRFNLELPVNLKIGSNNSATSDTRNISASGALVSTDLQLPVGTTLEIDIDMSEFSILTPFPHTPVTERFEKEGRILHRDWKKYTTAEVVYKPAQMTPDELQAMACMSRKLVGSSLRPVR